jgi:hypothetical protein
MAFVFDGVTSTAEMNNALFRLDVMDAERNVLLKQKKKP